jgi:uncharacterized protein (TIGR02453 family)
MLQESTLKFLKALKKQNNKEWFDVHRKEYEAAKQDFAAFTNHLIQLHAKNDASIAALTHKDCVFRINRDVRFSKNKEPYKTNMGTHIVQGGKKSMLAGYYFHCEPGGKSFMGGGMYMPDAEKMKKIRQEIDYNLEEFKAILNNKLFKKVYGKLTIEDGMQLQREPRGYEKDNPAIEYLKLKSWIATVTVNDVDLTDKQLYKKVEEAFIALKPLLDFLNRAML